MNEAETRVEHIDLSDSGLVRELKGMRHNRIYEYTAYLELLLPL